MRPPDEVRRDLVRQWVAKAAGDLAVASLVLSEATSALWAAGFHAQQAVEKYLKAFLVHHQIEFPKTHNLGVLLDLIQRADGSIAAALCEATALNPYGVDVRYPEDSPEVTPEDAQRAVALAEKVRDTILPALRAAGSAV